MTTLSVPTSRRHVSETGRRDAGGAMLLERVGQLAGHFKRRGASSPGKIALAVYFRVRVLLVRKNNAARIIDDGAALVGAEPGRRVAGRTALRAVTGDQENRVGHERAQRPRFV